LITGIIETLRKFEWPTKGYLIKVEPQFDYCFFFLFGGQASKGVTIPLVQKDKWEHIAVTFDGEEQIGYLNGETLHQTVNEAMSNRLIVEIKKKRS